MQKNKLSAVVLKDIDLIDLKILNLLQENSKLTNKEVAKALNMSTSPVFERIKKLETRGYIKKYVAILERAKLDRNLMVFLSVTLKQHTEETINEFIDFVNTTPEVVECYHISGNSDYFLKILINNMDDYHEFIIHKMANAKIINSMNSSFVLKEVKNSTKIPLSN